MLLLFIDCGWCIFEFMDCRKKKSLHLNTSIMSTIRNSYFKSGRFGSIKLIQMFWLRDCVWARTINSALKPTCCSCSVTVLMARLPVFTQSLQTFPSSRFFLLSIRGYSVHQI